MSGCLKQTRFDGRNRTSSTAGNLHRRLTVIAHTTAPLRLSHFFSSLRLTINAKTEFNKKGSRTPSYPLKNDGSTVASPTKLSTPPWFDKARFDAARSILADYFMSIFLCHLSGLVLLVFIKSIYKTLSLTGKSKDLVSIFYRYLHTIMHVKLWYEGVVYDSKDDAYHSLLRVKQMHQSVANTQNKGKKPNEDQLALSQRDMALTQFGFIGLIILHPEKMGFSTDPQKIERLIYFWRCIGHMLGIEDQYNLCNGDYATVRYNCQQIFNQKLRSKLITMRPGAAEMSKLIVVSASHYVWSLRWRGLLKFLFEVTDVPTDALNLNRYDKFFYHALQLCVGTLAHYRVLAFLLNNMLRFAFYRVIKSKSFVSNIVRSLERVHQNYICNITKQRHNINKLNKYE